MKGIKRYTFTCNDKRYTCWMSGQFLFQRYIFAYLAQNKLPSNKSSYKRGLKHWQKKYILLDSLLFIQ